MGANYSVLFYFPPLQDSRFPWCNNSFKTQRGRALGFPFSSQGWPVPNLPLLPHSAPFAVPQFPHPVPPLPTSQGCWELPFLKHFEALWGKALETCVCWSEPGGFALPKAPVVSPPGPQCRTRAHHLGNFLLFLPRQHNNPQTEMYIFARSTNLQVFLII